MALVTKARYVEITGDEDSEFAAIDSAIERATSALETTLRRGLAEAEYTEKLKLYRYGFVPSNVVYPSVTPVVSAGDLDFDDSVIFGPGPDGSPFAETNYATITYTAGYVERTENPDATNKLPICIEEDICWAAYSLLRPSDITRVPVGANSVRVGDLSIGYEKGLGSRSSQSYQWSDDTLRFRKRFI